MHERAPPIFKNNERFPMRTITFSVPAAAAKFYSIYLVDIGGYEVEEEGEEQEDLFTCRLILHF